MQPHDVGMVKILKDLNLILEPDPLLLVHAVLVDDLYGTDLLCLLVHALMHLSKSA
jgi:hypothetical protein